MDSHPLLEFPAYFRAIHLRNFRGFRKRQRIPLAPLTFLVGPNSSGKSSLSSALLFLSQSGFGDVDLANQVPNWGGPLVDLGSFEDAVYSHNARLSLEIGFEVLPLFLGGPWERDYSRRNREYVVRVDLKVSSSQDAPLGRVIGLTLVDEYSGEALHFRYGAKQVAVSHGNFEVSWRVRPERFYTGLSRGGIERFESYIKSLPRNPLGRKSGLRRLLRYISSPQVRWLMIECQRVSSGRAAPRRWYSVSEYQFRPTRDYWSPRVFDTVDPNMISQESRDEDYFYPFSRRRKRKRPPVSLTDVLKELEIGSDIRDIQLSAYHHSIKVTDSITNVISNLIDVGYGASQVIPVLHAALSNAQGLLVIEQPEIHLHPRAQGIVADLLCQTSHFRQVIVETHSVHMINHARLLIAKGDLRHDQVIVNYVQRNSSGSEVRSIPILRNGDFGAEWPAGFFDERYEDTMHLLHLKNQIQEQ